MWPDALQCHFSSHDYNLGLQGDRLFYEEYIYVCVHISFVSAG